jgi:long-chain fatty acid transport protein
MHRPASLRLTPLLAAALLAPAAARADGFALDIQGLYSNGTASAAAASTRDPAGMFANPAVLASLEGMQLVAGGQIIVGKAPYTDGGSSLLGGAMPMPGQNGDGAGTGGSPWIFASHKLSPRLTMGFYVAAPFGTATDYGRDSGFYGRYQGVESTIESVAFGPAAAWRLDERWSVGFSAAARRDSAVIGQSLDLGSICVGQAAAGGDPDPVATCASMGLSPAASDGYARYTGDGWGFTLNGGVTFQPRSGTTLGVAYRYESEGHVEGHQAFDEAAQAVLGFTGEPGAKIDLPLPGFLTVSVEHQLVKDLTLNAAFQYAFWSRFDTVDMELDDPTNGLAVSSKQGFRNAFRASLGAIWSTTPWLDTFAGASYEQSPVTDAYRQATLPERDSILIGVGANARLGGGFSLGAVYQHVQGTGEASINQAGATGDQLVGHVKASGDLVVLQAGWRH